MCLWERLDSLPFALLPQHSAGNDKMGSMADVVADGGMMHFWFNN